jgi:hypothetical protein
MHLLQKNKYVVSSRPKPPQMQFPNLMNIPQSVIDQAVERSVPIDPMDINSVELPKAAIAFKRHEYVKARLGATPSLEDMNNSIIFAHKTLLPVHLEQCAAITAQGVTLTLPKPNTPHVKPFSRVAGPAKASKKSPAKMGCYHF